MFEENPSCVLFFDSNRFVFGFARREDNPEDEEEDNHGDAAGDEGLEQGLDEIIPAPVEHERIDDAPNRIDEDRDHHPANEVPHRLPPRIAMGLEGDVALKLEVDALRGEDRDFKGDEVA